MTIRTNSRPSDKKLGDDLVAAGYPELAARAYVGEFNDFFGQHVTPKAQLMLELAQREAKPELMTAVAGGVYDSGPDEADEWAASPEGRRAMKEITG